MLLDLRRDAGTSLRDHRNFDSGGMHIANTLGRAVTFTPWRFTGTDYRAAVEGTLATQLLEGQPVVANWDLDLAPALEMAGLAIEEEGLVELLLADLRRSDRSPHAGGTTKRSALGSTS